jgi:heptosyltransferase-1
MQRPAADSAMRILLVKTTSMGDVIHNLPVASDIRRALPQATIDWVVEESFAEIPRLHPAVAGVIPVAVRRWRKSPLAPATWREIGAFRRAVRRPAGADFFDAVIDTQGLVKSALLAAQAHGRKCGHAASSAREPLAARFYDVRFEIPKDLHAVERNRRLAAAALGYSLNGLPLDYGLTHSPTLPPLQAGWLPRGDYAVLLTATSRADKEWPEADWHSLGTALIAAGLRCVLPGGSELERTRAARLAQSLGNAVAAPPLNLTALAGLLAGAKLVVGVDTGLVHLAAALGRPTLALYCASDPALTGVHAATPALNLGGRAAPPAAAEAVAAALKLLG